MIDENNNCITKSKLTIAVSLCSKYNQRSRLAAKQTNRLRDTETGKHLGRKHTKGAKCILTNRRTSKLIVDTRAERVKQNIKDEAPYVLLLLKQITNIDK